MSQSEYLLITKLVNKNLSKKKEKLLHFELFDNLDMDLHHCSAKRLMNIKDTSDFVREVFFKLLNRDIDEEHLNSLLPNLTTEQAKLQFLRDVYKSNERKTKQTDLIFDL